MLKTKKLLSIVLLSLVAASGIFAAEPVKEVKDDSAKMHLLHNWGFSWARVTRLKINKDRSNFVWQDDMVGAYYAIQTDNLPVNFIAKVSAYYPYHIEFNQVTQISKQVLVYAFDFNAGPIWTIPLWKIARLDLAPVVNFRYQMDDFYNHFELGLGGIVGFEFPVSHHFSVLLNGEFTYDYGNLGKNKISRPYDHVWSYQAQLGFRISKKVPNDFYYFGYKILN